MRKIHQQSCQLKPPRLLPCRRRCSSSPCNGLFCPDICDDAVLRDQLAHAAKWRTMRALFLTTTAALPISDLVIRGDVTRPPPRPGQCRLADIDGKSRTRLSKIGMPDAQTKRDWSDLSFTEPLRDSHERGQRFIPAVTGFLYQRPLRALISDARPGIYIHLTSPKAERGHAQSAHVEIGWQSRIGNNDKPRSAVGAQVQFDRV